MILNIKPKRKQWINLKSGDKIKLKKNNEPYVCDINGIPYQNTILENYIPEISYSTIERLRKKYGNI